ncbi:putative transcriptional regulator, TetR family [Gordonia polyisoprenivorans VH2]|uniref:Putative transcriptional regulator, TetR family n=1 Tax=Gordonia polyisoprenivorans (strain DSM 44266 / VH2) TaxID=1112204 RepID=H6MXH5_GORPV|nr:putative transcriptional regulator, TetR family [Gordonia polyisoprenivorans VH2]
MTSTLAIGTPDGLGNLVEVTTRQTYAEASRALLRTTLLDGLRDLLVEKDWPSITMADVARKSGVGRQTVYNEFGSRHGLAQAYAMRLATEFADIVASTVAERPHDIHGALHDAFAAFFAVAAADPLITSLQRGEAKPDLLRLITTDAAPLITTASARLTDMLTISWLGLADDDAVRIARAITRMALSYVAMPPESDRDVAADLAAVMAPAVIAARGGETESGATPTTEE